MPVLLLIVNILIFILLCIGAYSDLKTRTVSNKITYSIGILCIILILIYGIASWMSGIFILLFISLYFFNLMGGADMKVLVPMILIIPNPEIFVLIISVLGGIYALISWSKEIPYFVPITLGFLEYILL